MPLTVDRKTRIDYVERCTVLQILRIQLCFGGYKFRLLASLMRHQIITFATIKLTIDAGKSSNKIVIFISNFAQPNKALQNISSVAI
jgi:DNA polymerase III delta subunit